MAPGPAPQKSRIVASRALLHLLALFADRSLQGPAHTLAISAILRGLARPELRNQFRHFPPALFHQYPAILESCPAVSLLRPQRRNQYHRVQSPLVARQGKSDSRKIDRRLLV